MSCRAAGTALMVSFWRQRTSAVGRNGKGSSSRELPRARLGAARRGGSAVGSQLSIVSTAARGRWETRPLGNEAAFGLLGNRAVGKRNSQRQCAAGQAHSIGNDWLGTDRNGNLRGKNLRDGNVRKVNARKGNDPSTSLSPKLAIANTYAIRSWPEQRELRGPLAESTFGSMIPSSRVHARLRCRCKRTPSG